MMEWMTLIRTLRLVLLGPAMFGMSLESIATIVAALSAACIEIQNFSFASISNPRYFSHLTDTISCQSNSTLKGKTNFLCLVRTTICILLAANSRPCSARQSPACFTMCQTFLLASSSLAIITEARSSEAHKLGSHRQKQV